MRRTARSIKTLPLFGRDDQAADLFALLDRASTGGTQVALVEGEAGIGKTRLLSAVVDAAAERGFEVYLGVARELEQDRPFGVFATALDLRTGSPDPERAAIAEVLRGGSDADNPAEARFRIVEGLLDVVERSCARGPVLLAVEDLHWADEASLVALSHIASRLADQSIAVVATCRPVPRSAAVERVAGDLTSAPGIYVRLAPLDAASSAAMARELVGAEPDAQLEQTLARAGGNPLFVLELTSALLEEGAIRVEHGRATIDSMSVPPPLKMTIIRRLGSLPPDTLDVLRAASILGSSFSVSDLSTVIGRAVGDLVAPLGVALAAGFLAEDGDRLAFRHDLVRDTLYEDQPLAIRKGLHVEAARRLAGAGAPSVQVATQFALGASDGDAEAIAWLRTAAGDIGTHAPSVAVRFLTRTVELMGQRHPDRDAALVELVQWLTWAGQLEQARRHAADVLTRTRDASRAASMHYALAKGWVWSGRPAESLEELEKAVRLPGLPEADRAFGLAEIALRLMHARDVGAALTTASAAQSAAERSGNSVAAFAALCANAVALEYSGRFAEAADLAIRSTELAHAGQFGEPPNADLYLAQSLIGADRLDEADAALESLRAERLDRQQTGLLANAGAVHAGQLLLAGRWDDAVVVAESSIALSDDTGFRALMVRAIAVLAHIAVRRDDLERARHLLERAEREIAASGPGRWGVTWYLWAHALLLEANGDHDGALGVLGGAWDLCSLLGSIGEYRDIAPDLARIAAAAGDRDRLRATAEGAERLGAIAGVSSARGAALLCRGLVDDDVTMLQAAVDAYREGPRPIDRAFACEQAGAAIGDGDRGAAAALLEEAVTVYEGVGARRDVARVEAALRRVGVQRRSRRPRRTATSGWDSLTPSEREVVGLVAAGLRNAEIAARLFVSRRTVETHLTHVFAKLGLTSRVQLAAESVRRAGP